MQQDDMIWHCMNQGFCSFKVKTKTQHLCRNDNNVLGICARSACPLANSNYATVREHRGIIYLCKKVVERASFPQKLWEKIPLPGDKVAALNEISTLLPYWDSKLVQRCKKRYTKIHETLQRSRKLATKMRAKKLITLPRKMERREKAREKKALIAARLESNIEMEIMNRVKQGVYGDRYKFADKHTFEKALTGESVEEPVASTSKAAAKRRAKELEETTTREVKLSNKYVPDMEDLMGMDGNSDEDDDDVEQDDFWASEDEEWEREQAERNSKRERRNRTRLTIEHEQ